MDAQQIRDRAETALAAVGFVVREDDSDISADVPHPGGACLFVQNGQARLYLFPFQQRQAESADAAARTLAGAGLRVIPVGVNPTEASTKSAYVLLGGTGELTEGRDPVRGPFSEGWRDQYERMLRSRQRLAEAAGPSSMGSKEARDRLFHFFQDAYHLKDWLKNDDDPRIPREDIEPLFTNQQRRIPVFRLAADLCNGIKHRTLIPGRSKTGDDNTTFTRQDVHIMLGGPVTARAFVGGGEARVEPGPPPPPALGEHRWFVTSNGQQYDVLDLADEVIAEWEKWLTDQGLLP